MHCWREIGILFDAEGVGYWMAREFLAGFQVLFGGMNREDGIGKGMTELIESFFFFFCFEGEGGGR